MRNAAMLILVLGTSILTGCAAPNGMSRQGSGSAVARLDWPFQPASIRIHPLTRITIDESGRQMLHVRVELLDGEGDTTKAIGMLSVNMRDRPGERLLGPSLAWDRDLSELDLNRLHWDDVTRTYLLRSVINRAMLPEQPWLVATLQVPHGRLLTSDDVRLAVPDWVK